MDILVMLEDGPDHSPVLAHVNSVPSPLTSPRRSRDVVTLYGLPSAEVLALAVAAAVEGHRASGEDDGWAGMAAIHHLGIWPERGAVGDVAWRDPSTGQLVTRELEIPAEVLHGAASQLLDECGDLIRRLVAGLLMPDWPEGTRRAITFTLTPVRDVAPGAASGDAWLDRFREADGGAVGGDGD